MSSRTRQQQAQASTAVLVIYKASIFMAQYFQFLIYKMEMYWCLKFHTFKIQKYNTKTQVKIR